MEVESTLREVLTLELSKGVMHLEKRSKCQLIPWMSQEESIVSDFFQMSELGLSASGTGGGEVSQLCIL